MSERLILFVIKENQIAETLGISALNDITYTVQTIFDRELRKDIFKKIERVNQVATLIRDQQEIEINLHFSENERDKDKKKLAELTKIGGEYLYAESYNNLLNFLENKYCKLQNIESADIIKFNSGGKYTVNVNNCSLINFFNSKKIDDEFLVSSLSFFLASLNTQVNGFNINSVTYDYPSSIVKKYLNDELKKQIKNSLLTTKVMLSEDKNIEEMINRKIVSSTIPGKEALIAIKNGQKKFKEVRQKIMKLLLTPNSPIFNQLKIIIKPIDFQLLKIIRTYKIDNIKFIYRKSKEFIKQQTETEFYQSLVDTLDKFVQHEYIEDEILTEEDINSIFNTNSQIITRSEKTKLENFKTYIDSITKKTRTKNFFPDPKTINWEDLPEPKLIKFIFNKDSPQKFEVNFEYTNISDKLISLKVNVDLNKNSFDWSIVNDPEELIQQKELILLTIQKVLNKIKNDTEEQKIKDLEEVKRVQNNKYNESSKKIRVDDYELYQFKKQKNESINSNETKPSPIIELKNKAPGFIKIILPDKNIKDLFENIESQHVNYIFEKIEYYNSGFGKVKALSQVNDKNERYYAFKLNSPIGHIRVVLVLSEKNGETVYEIAKIIRRNDNSKIWSKI